MYVYRVQTEDGFGPYQGQVAEAHHWGDECPSPTEDGIPDNVRWEYSHHYGFESLEHMVNWFTKPSLLRFETQGFYVWRFTVDPLYVIKGSKQLCFLMEKSTECTRVKYDEYSSIQDGPNRLDVSGSEEGALPSPPRSSPFSMAYAKLLANSNMKWMRL